MLLKVYSSSDTYKDLKKLHTTKENKFMGNPSTNSNKILIKFAYTFITYTNTPTRKGMTLNTMSERFQIKLFKTIKATTTDKKLKLNNNNSNPETLGQNLGKKFKIERD